jgi:hypothetical protein
MPVARTVLETTSGPRGGIIGREAELLSLHGFIASDAVALVIGS